VHTNHNSGLSQVTGARRTGPLSATATTRLLAVVIRRNSRSARYRHQPYLATRHYCGARASISVSSGPSLAVANPFVFSCAMGGHMPLSSGTWHVSSLSVWLRQVVSTPLDLAFRRAVTVFARSFGMELAHGPRPLHRGGGVATSPAICWTSSGGSPLGPVVPASREAGHGYHSDLHG